MGFCAVKLVGAVLFVFYGRLCEGRTKKASAEQAPSYTFPQISMS